MGSTRRKFSRKCQHTWCLLFKNYSICFLVLTFSLREKKTKQKNPQVWIGHWGTVNVQKVFSTYPPWRGWGNMFFPTVHVSSKMQHFFQPGGGGGLPNVHFFSTKGVHLWRSQFLSRTRCWKRLIRVMLLSWLLLSSSVIDTRCSSQGLEFSFMCLHKHAQTPFYCAKSIYGLST